MNIDALGDAKVNEEEASLICEGRHEDQLLKSYLLSEINAPGEGH